MEEVARDLKDRDEALRQLKTHLTRAQEHMRRMANTHRRDVNFSIGDWVYLKLRPHKQKSAAQRINQKLAPRYFGPFQIEEKLGPVAYKVNLPASSKIHPVFHVSLLKPAVVTQTINATLPAEYTLDDTDILLPYKVLAQRSISSQGNTINQFLIQWHYKPVEEATWEEKRN